MTRAPYVKLGTLAPGSRFRTESGTLGTLLKVNECRARVQLDARARTVTIQDDAGNVQASWEAPGRAVDIAPGTEVQQIA
jgi:preprotein translocase subunit YajC